MTDNDLFDVVVRERDGKAIRTRMGPYSKKQADSIARFTKSYPTEVVEHDSDACRKAKEAKSNGSDS
jgi:hypothetical protein